MQKMIKAFVASLFIVLSVWLIPLINDGSSFFTQGQAHVKSSQKSDTAEIAGSIVVSDNPEDIIEYAKNQGLRTTNVTKKGRSGQAMVALEEMPDHPKIKALEKQNNVTVTPNYVYRSFFTPNDTKYNEQWNLPKISAPKAWDITTGSSDVTVAVLDSGVLFEQTIDGTAYNQPDFPNERAWTNPAETGMTEAGDNCWTGTPEDKKTNNCDDSGNELIDDWRGWDFMGGYRGDDAGCPNHNSPSTYENANDSTFVMQDNDPQPYSCDSPDEPSVLNKNHYDGTCEAFVSACFVGHGTMVASVATAQTNNDKLIAGIDNNTGIMSVRVLDGYGWGSTDRLVGGLHYAADNGADVINLSLGSNCDDESFSDPLVEEALQAAVDAGAVIVAASGNGNLNTVCYPASSSEVMAIGATDSNDERESYSNYSDKLDVVAPAGVPVANAPSARINSNYYSNAGGTSLSTPHVAGLASLLRGETPSLSRDSIRKIIRIGADKVDGMEGQAFHPEYGYGRIDLYQSLTYNSYTWSIESNEVYADEAMTKTFTSTITVPPNDTVYIRLRVKNNGNVTWEQDWARIGTAKPRDRESLFYNADWLSQTRATQMIESTVAPGDIGTFEFQLKAPSQTGSYTEWFNGVAESRRWFNNEPIPYKINVVEPIEPSNSSSVELLPGQQLNPGDYLLSPDRHSTLVLQKNGNLVYSTHFEQKWSSDTAGKEPGRLLMQDDGNLVLYGNDGSVLWHSATHGNDGARLTTQTNGDLTVRDKNDGLLWSTNTVHFPDNLGMVNRILPTGTFYPGQILQTADRRFKLVLQSDGNLVLYSPNRATWASYTNGKDAARLVMQDDGNLVLYDSSGTPIWHTKTNGQSTSRLVIQPDGNLVLYNANNHPTWHTKTHGIE